MFTEITNAEYVGDYKLRVIFNNGIKKTVDFYTILFQKDYPVFRPLKDIDNFKKFKITDTLEWENGTIDIAPETIYEMGVMES